MNIWISCNTTDISGKTDTQYERGRGEKRSKVKAEMFEQRWKCKHVHFTLSNKHPLWLPLFGSMLLIEIQNTFSIQSFYWKLLVLYETSHGQVGVKDCPSWIFWATDLVNREQGTEGQRAAVFSFNIGPFRRSRSIFHTFSIKIHY